MTEAQLWVRWKIQRKSSKWHIASDAGNDTLCGRGLRHEWYESKLTRTQPVDDFGVCLHCLRAQEIDARAVEALNEEGV
jgi:hypothetical protein